MEIALVYLALFLVYDYLVMKRWNANIKRVKKEIFKEEDYVKEN
jgi:hypothetical protein